MVVKPLVGGVPDSFLFRLSLDVRRVVFIIVPSVTDFFFFKRFPSLTAGVYFCTCGFLFVFKVWVCNA